VKKVTGYISFLSIWFALIIIIAHQVIPHDHHASDTNCVSEDVNPESSHNPFHNHGLPRHCHAFNELTAEETIRVVPVSSTLSDSYLLTGNPEIPYSQVSVIIITEHHALQTKMPLQRLHSLRAPPQLS
jgi:hypothetical protein